MGCLLKMWMQIHIHIYIYIYIANLYILFKQFINNNNANYNVLQC